MNDDLKITVTDPDDVRAKLPRVLEIQDELRRAANDAKVKADDWDRFVTGLQVIAATDSPPSKVAVPVNRNGKKSSGSKIAAKDTRRKRDDGKFQPSPGGGCKELIVATLEEAGGPVPAAYIRAKFPQFKYETFADAFKRLKADGKIQNVARGVYAPMSYQPEELPLSSNGGGS